ncbi:hypothetical protein, partial [Micrococcus luteus]|uniref:hypothetical protein n=1 Tax=Micrococcus luteus TaxID=1270 RepID=UPI0011AB3E43
HPVYIALYFLLIIPFTYFYLSITFNPLHISHNINPYAPFIPPLLCQPSRTPPPSPLSSHLHTTILPHLLTHIHPVHPL